MSPSRGLTLAISSPLSFFYHSLVLSSVCLFIQLLIPFICLRWSHVLATCGCLHQRAKHTHSSISVPIWMLHFIWPPWISISSISWGHLEMSCKSAPSFYFLGISFDHTTICPPPDFLICVCVYAYQYPQLKVVILLVPWNSIENIRPCTVFRNFLFICTACFANMHKCYRLTWVSQFLTHVPSSLWPAFI